MICNYEKQNTGILGGSLLQPSKSSYISYFSYIGHKSSYNTIQEAFLGPNLLYFGQKTMNEFSSPFKQATSLFFPCFWMQCLSKISCILLNIFEILISAFKLTQVEEYCSRLSAAPPFVKTQPQLNSTQLKATLLNQG